MIVESRLARLGQVDTVVGPPSLASHVECTEERRAAGMPEGLIRHFVRIEDIEDLKADMNQALSIPWFLFVRVPWWVHMLSLLA